MERAKFEQLVREALESLPDFFKRRLENIALVVQDYPGPEVRERFPGLVLGLYHGVPRPQRSVWAQPPFPDVIYIYQKNIEAICHTPEEIKQQVRETVVHEIGHYFGLTDEEMARLRREGS